MTMRSDRQIVFIDALRPIWLRKTPYWHRPSLRGLFNQNPYHGRTPGLAKRTLPWLAWGLGLRLCAWLMRPAPAVIAAALIAFAWWGDAAINSNAYRDGPDLICTYQSASGRQAYRFERAARDESCPRFVFFGNLFG